MQGMPDSVRKYEKNRRYLRGKTYFFLQLKNYLQLYTVKSNTLITHSRLLRNRLRFPDF